MRITHIWYKAQFYLTQTSFTLSVQYVGGYLVVYFLAFLAHSALSWIVLV